AHFPDRRWSRRLVVEAFIAAIASVGTLLSGVAAWQSLKASKLKQKLDELIASYAAKDAARQSNDPLGIRAAEYTSLRIIKTLLPRSLHDADAARDIAAMKELDEEKGESETARQALVIIHDLEDKALRANVGFLSLAMRLHMI